MKNSISPEDWAAWTQKERKSSQYTSTTVSTREWNYASKSTPGGPLAGGERDGRQTPGERGLKRKASGKKITARTQKEGGSQGARKKKNIQKQDS